MYFAEIVRSPSDVRNAYCGILVHSWWWRIILALHGKPSDLDANSASSRLCLARGFRFYGYLYLLLASVMIATAPLILVLAISDALFWAGLLVVSSVFLGCSCQLAFAGSRRFLDEPKAASLLLLTFFVSVMVYLSCFCGVCLMIVHSAIPEYDIATVIAFASLMIFGIGSYFVEILFQAANHSTQSLA